MYNVYGLGNLKPHHQCVCGKPTDDQTGKSVQGNTSMLCAIAKFSRPITSTRCNHSSRFSQNFSAYAMLINYHLSIYQKSGSAFLIWTDNCPSLFAWKMTWHLFELLTNKNVK